MRCATLQIMTSPSVPPDGPPNSNPVNPPPPEEPTTKKKAYSDSNRGFDSMLKGLHLTPQQREAFFKTLMQQAATTLKNAFNHFVQQMKNNKNND